MRGVRCASDRYAAEDDSPVRGAGPQSGPRRAERDKKILRISQGLGRMSWAGPWLIVAALGATLMAQGRQTFPGNANLPFSAAVKADGLIYVAGTMNGARY